MGKPVKPVVVGRDEITPEVYDRGGIVVGHRGEIVVLVSYEPGGKVAWCVEMDDDLAEAVGRALIEHARMVRR